MCSCHLAPLSANIHTIRATHSQHHTLFNSYKMVRSQLLCSHLLLYRRLMVLLLQVSCPAHCYHAVQSAHKSLRVPPVMSQIDVMPLAEAITQLSFLEFLQRCGVPIAPPQSSQLPVPISLLDAAVQTIPPCDAFQGVSTQTSDQQVSSIFFDVAVQTSSHGIHTSSLDAAVQTIPPCDAFQGVSTQTSDQQVSSIFFFDVAVQTSSHGIHTSSLDAAVQTIPHRTLFQHVSTQMGSRSASSCSVDMFVQTPIRSTVLHDVAIQTDHGVLHWLSLLERSSGPKPKLCSSVPVISTRSTCLAAATAGDSNSSHRLEVSLFVLHQGLYTTHGTSTTSAPLRARLRSAISVSPPQLPACTIHVGTHHSRSATTCKRSASPALV